MYYHFYKKVSRYEIEIVPKSNHVSVAHSERLSDTQMNYSEAKQKKSVCLQYPGNCCEVEKFGNNSFHWL